jgi:hypothetical protein
VSKRVDTSVVGVREAPRPMLNFAIDPDLLARVDDFRYDSRFRSRAEALHWLLKWALDQNPKR